ncbi:glycosyltransferase [Blastococcus sp. URHD0036]|uniref:glycosyltransferase n=1 Tax=Blastococcus sp. URHD0036 TaxID=1380356 RepID=UPI00049749B0|nr:glycosyltransferase [Blastococcus sp. URHD0036]
MSSPADPADHTARPRALAVVTFFPWPLDHGDALRRFMVLEGLAATTDLTAVCVRRPDTTDAQVAELRDRLPGVHVLALAPWQRDLGTPAARLGRIVRGLSRATPPWVFRQWSPELDAALAEAGSGHDLAVLVGEPGGLAAGRVHATRVIWDKSNVLTATDLDALSTVSSPIGKLRALTALPLHWAFERRVLRSVDEVVVTSAEERERLRRFFGDRPAAVLPSAVDAPPPAPGTDPAGRVLLWMSTLSYTPNWDGLQRFLRAAGPELERGGWTLRVVGAGGSAAQAEELAGHPAVDYRGFVPELADACAGVAAGVVPVWAGAGVKLKTLTLMALGVPLVATPVALEGIPHEAAAAVVRTPEDFAGALAGLTPQDLATAAARGRTVVEQQFSRAGFLRGVAELVEGTRA